MSRTLFGRAVADIPGLHQHGGAFLSGQVTDQFLRCRGKLGRLVGQAAEELQAEGLRLISGERGDGFSVCGTYLWTADEIGCVEKLLCKRLTGIPIFLLREQFLQHYSAALFLLLPCRGQKLFGQNIQTVLLLVGQVPELRRQFLLPGGFCLPVKVIDSACRAGRRR